MVPAGLSNSEAVDKQNSQENGTRGSADAKNFSQVGGWVLHGYQGRNSMYTRDREGIVGEEPAPNSRDPQASSCMKHLLFGHGNTLTHVGAPEQFRDRDFRTCTDLAIHNKVKSKLFLDPHFDAEAHLSRQAGTASSAFHTAARSSSTAARQQQTALPASVRPYNASYAPQLDASAVARYGEVDALRDARRTTGFKHYEDFTKRFDQSQVKTQLRAPYYK